jgi:uncharacterized membrane protein
VSTNAQTRERLDFVDAQRGLAVVLMIWMHTADAWLVPALKRGAAWDVVRSLGGLAAPTFLLLVGLSLGLGWARASQTVTWAVSRRDLARGLQLIVLGYGLRVQMWQIDAGGFSAPGGLVGAALLTVSYVALYRGLGTWAGGSPWWREAALAATASALAWSGALAAQPPPTSLLRVDVLQAIGASIVVLVLARPALTRRPELGIVFGVLVALATPWLKRWVPGSLPVPLAAYVAQWAPAAGERVTSLFPLFPWLAYALIGAAIGPFLARAVERGQGARAVGWLSLLGAGLALIACEPLPLAGGLLRAAPWLSDLSRVTYRVGAALLLGGLAWVVGRGLLRPPLVLLGRTSLFVYWVHLELAFGAVATPIAHELDYDSWLIGWALLVLLMTLLAGAWLRLRGSVGQPRPTADGRSTPGFSGA